MFAFLYLSLTSALCESQAALLRVAEIQEKSDVVLREASKQRNGFVFTGVTSWFEAGVVK